MKSGKPSAALLAFAGVITCLTWPLAAMLRFRLGEKTFGISLFGPGLPLGLGLAVVNLAGLSFQTFCDLTTLHYSVSCS